MGVLAALNQFQSQGGGADISYKMGEKAKKGGTIGRAPLGYRNVREHSTGVKSTPLRSIPNGHRTSHRPSNCSPPVNTPAYRSPRF